MTDTKEADLAAVTATCELNIAVASHPKFADNLIVVAAIANAKANHAAFIAAVKDADAARGFRRLSAYSHVRRACAASDGAQKALIAAVRAAEDE
jgi:hypothetical protein